MVFYLHSIYNGGHPYFVFDIWSERDQCFKEIPLGHFDGSLELAKVYAIAENAGCRKLILDF